MTPILLDRNENRYGPAPECLAALREMGPEILFNHARFPKRLLQRALAPARDADGRN